MGYRHIPIDSFVGSGPCVAGLRHVAYITKEVVPSSRLSICDHIFRVGTGHVYHRATGVTAEQKNTKSCTKLQSTPLLKTRRINSQYGYIQ